METAEQQPWPENLWIPSVLVGWELILGFQAFLYVVSRFHWLVFLTLILIHIAWSWSAEPQHSAYRFGFQFACGFCWLVMLTICATCYLKMI